MAEFLSQEEIDELLDIADSAELNINNNDLSQREINELYNVVNNSKKNKLNKNIINKKFKNNKKTKFLSQEEIDRLLDIAEDCKN